MPDYKEIRQCTIIFNLPLISCLKFQAKQTRKQKCLKLKTPSFQRCRITQKERSLILVAKGLQESIPYLAKVGSTLTNRLRSRRHFFFQPQITKWHISKKMFYTCALHAPEKTRNTWLFTCNYTFYIWKQTLFDFWVSGPILSLGKLRKKVVSLQKLSCSLNILGGQLRWQ